MEETDYSMILEQAKRVLERDELYTNLVKNYIDNQKRIDNQQMLFRWVFFIIVCYVFIAVIGFGSLGIWTIAKKENITWTDIGAALAGLGSILSVIIILPSKIAEHLFPVSGIKNSFDFILSMREGDLTSKSQKVDVTFTKKQ